MAEIKTRIQKPIELHKKTIKKMFKQEPKIFRNTELIFNNEIAHDVEQLGYKGIIAEGADHILGWRSPNYLYRPKTTEKIKLLLKNYKLSDDIAFRFSNRGWTEFPLTADKYSAWTAAAQGQTINLFMDYETFGEHQWEDTGIFNFMKHLPEQILKYTHMDFKTPSELTQTYEPVAELDIHNIISWADVERDISAWQGNKIQQAALNMTYSLGEKILLTNNSELINDWRKLTTSDHFYYMCTKWFSDGDVHKYFNPYDSPYDSFIYYMNVLNDLKLRVKKEGIELEK
jgi:alpha-amylase